LYKAWKGYIIAKNKCEFDRRYHYAEVIQKLQKELGLPISLFLDLGLVPKCPNRNPSEEFDREMQKEQNYNPSEEFDREMQKEQNYNPSEEFDREMQKEQNYNPSEEFDREMQKEQNS
jgi:hypothetical protein